MAMEDIVTQYNELRNECLVLMDLRGLASAVEFELQNLRQTYKCLNPEGASVRSRMSIPCVLMVIVTPSSSYAATRGGIDCGRHRLCQRQRWRSDGRR